MKNKLLNKVSVKAGRVGLKFQKNRPGIEFVFGLAATVYATYKMCKATTKLEAVVEKNKENINKIRETAPEETRGKELAKGYVGFAWDIFKLYGPAALLYGTGIGMLTDSHYILNKRNAGLSVAYTGLSEAFKDYRKRVQEEEGDAKDLHYLHGTTKEKVDVIELDENGKEKKTKKVMEVLDPNKISEYAKWFDEGSRYWKKDATLNYGFLKSQQNYMNELLKSRGHVLLNDVYDALDIPRTADGAVIGWIYDEDNPIGDNFIDFGIFNEDNPRARDFVNGYERNILLDFNVDGVVYHLLDKQAGLKGIGFGDRRTNEINLPRLFRKDK